MIGLDVAAHVSSVVEVYMTLRLLGLLRDAGAAYIIESLTKVINFAFGFVPGTIGVYETGNGIILATLGYTMAIGLALAIVRKAAIIFWTVIGVLVLTCARCRMPGRVCCIAVRVCKNLPTVSCFQTSRTVPRAPP